jgi:hypothetical protein
MKAVSLALAAALLAGGTAATAQSASDARCIVLSSVFSRTGKDAQAKQLAEAAMYFYLGRVSPSASPAQLKAQLDQQAATITDANNGKLMGDCIKNFTSEVTLLQSIAGSAKPAATKPTQPDGR